MKLIVLYGYMSNQHNGKTQRLIDGEMTCGYREYAEYAGSIIYVSPQDVHLNWEYSMTDEKRIVDYCHSHPEAAIFSVKVDPNKNKLLSKIKNFKLHYPCNGRNLYNPYCDISLVDTSERLIHENCRIHVKGKNPDFWKPSQDKEYDYLLMGRRDDKNQSYFIKRLNDLNEPRRVLWIGGYEFRKVVKSKHYVNYTKVCGPEEIRSIIPKAKVGILYSQIKTEGFPQSFLEMTMCGVPVVYGGPSDNPYYFFEENSIRPSRKHLLGAAEELLAKCNSVSCREVAIKNYSIQKSVERMLSFR